MLEKSGIQILRVSGDGKTKIHHVFSKQIIGLCGKQNILTGEVATLSFVWLKPSEQDIFVDIEGQKLVVKPNEPLEFSSDVAGEYLIQTVNDYVENAFVRMVVTDE